MRIAILVHAFPPRSNTGVEVYSESLARAFVAAGHEVEVCAARLERTALHLAQRREVREGFGVTWVTLSAELDNEDLRRNSPGAARAFGRFLDREKPDVVHLQHVLGFGAEVVDEARSRDIPVLFTAHDAFAFTDEYTLVAPDLSALDPLDRLTRARCRLARGVLDGALEHHDGYLVPEFADPELLGRVRKQLQGPTPGLETLAAKIDEQVSRRLDALDRADYLEAPTEFLADLLEKAGVGSTVHKRACGIEQGALEELAATRAGTDGPLRVLYLGGYFEHKGVHVLLEAAAGLGQTVSLTLRGCFGSSAYRTDLERLARDVGASLGGPFERAEIRDLLAGADVLALPSLWPENAPFVLREAFAAGLPVLVSDTPALRETVSDGLAGRCVPMGDVSAWRSVLEELAGDRASLAALARNVCPPKTIEQDARELLELYRGLITSRREGCERRLARLPRHVQDFAGRHAALDRLSVRELCARGIEGLLQLGLREGVELQELQGAQEMLAQSERLRERLADATRSDLWRQELELSKDRALQHALEQVAALNERASSEEQRANWERGLREERESRLASGELALEDLREQCAWLVGVTRAREQELEWRVSELTSRSEELSWNQEQLEESRAELGEWQAQFDQRAAKLTVVQGELDLVRDDRDRVLDDREAARTHEGFLEGELGGQAEQLDSLRKQLEGLCAEVDWRAKEMDLACDDGDSFPQRVLGGDLQRRLKQWRAEDEGGEPS